MLTIERVIYGLSLCCPLNFPHPEPYLTLYSPPAPDVYFTGTVAFGSTIIIIFNETKKRVMKPILMRHVEPRNESFKAWVNADPYLHNPWHYHPECEINMSDRGQGLLFIGDKVTSYDKDDVILIGPNLPHEWRSSNKETPDFHTRSMAIHFAMDFPGKDFYLLPEAQVIYQLLLQSKRGIKINDGETQQKVKGKMQTILNTEGIERINMLFSILDIIAASPNLEILASQSFVDSLDESQDQRMLKIYKYVMTHFKEQISVEQLAAEVNMTATSFCRFFKKRTNKSFMQYVTEIRIGYACKLLYTQSYNISEVAYESGFENISNFNKQFLKVKKQTPSQLLAQFAQKQ
jgi:AraC-like DNA-binding protein/quercetin dioxygenase-like cupin family protein